MIKQWWDKLVKQVNKYNVDNICKNGLDSLREPILIYKQNYSNAKAVIKLTVDFPNTVKTISILSTMELKDLINIFEATK